MLYLLWISLLFQKISPEQWIKQNLERYFAQHGSISESDICTPTYLAYKNDALQVNMDEGLTPQEFNKKWKSTFQTKFAGVGAGYFISGQDFSTIKVISCKAISKKATESWWRVQLQDKDFKAIYHRDIKLVLLKGTYKIADVKEYD